MTTKHEDQKDGIPPLPARSRWQKISALWSAYRMRQQSLQWETGRKHPKARFDHLLKTANDIAARNPRALADLVRAILRPLQSEYLLGVAELDRDPYPELVQGHFFGEAVNSYLWKSGGLWWQDRQVDPQSFSLRLARDTVLPCAWNYSRYVDAMARYGEGKRDEMSSRWRQDNNHRVSLWLPWSIDFVAGGNHSITAGILAGDGHLRPESVYDMSFLLDAIRCDGLHYRDAQTNTELAPVTDVRRAAVFEIGRLMVQTNCPAFTRKVLDSASLAL